MHLRNEESEGIALCALRNFEVRDGQVTNVLRDVGTQSVDHHLRHGLQKKYLIQRETARVELHRFEGREKPVSALIRACKVGEETCIELIIFRNRFQFDFS